MSPADDLVSGPLPDALMPRDIPGRWFLLENTTIYPDALRRLLQAEGEHPPTLETSSSAINITPEVLNSAIVQVNAHDKIGVSVYRGLLELPGRRPMPVAIQVDRSEVYDQLILARETKIWPTLDHARILPLLGHGTLGSMTTALVTPYFGANVESYLHDHPELDKRRLIIHVAEGLEYLHNQRDMIHGDLEGSSVLINADGDVVLGGFELSISPLKLPRVNSTMTAIRQNHSLRRYAAPELLVDESPDTSGRQSKTTASDIYAFGMLVYRILSGRLPWHGCNELKVILSVASGQRPPRPQESQMNDSMWNLCVACWDQDPAKRPCIADILAGLRSPEPPMRWHVVGKHDLADPLVPFDLPAPDGHAETPTWVPFERPPDDEIPESTLRVVLGGADVEIALPTQTPMRGGFGKVFEGHARIHGVVRVLAVKKCPSLTVQPREYSIWKSLSHKNILPLYAAIELRGLSEFIFVSPYMTKGNLVDYLKLNTRVHRLPLMTDVAAGLEYLHNIAKIVHGDIKAENVLIADDGRAVLSDFGLSTTVAPGTQLSGSHVRELYTLAYAAPEIIDDNAVDPNAPGILRSKTRMTDMYAYGVLLYQAYAGGFGRNMRARILLIAAMHEGRLPKRPVGLLHVLCDDLWSICKRCWARKAADRPPIATVLGELQDLETSPERQAIETPEPEEPQQV